MLSIRFGDFTEDCIVNVNGYFDAAKKKDWFNDPMVKRIIKELDKSDAIKDEYIESPVLGAIPPQRLSGSCKAVILMWILENPHIYGTKCGDNCAPLILEIAKTKDLLITLHHCMHFPKKFEAYLPELNKTVHSDEEFVEEFYEFRNNRM